MNHVKMYTTQVCPYCVRAKALLKHFPEQYRYFSTDKRKFIVLEPTEALPADARDYGVAAAMLGQLGVRRVRLLTNNPDKLAGLAACGIRVEAREAHAFPPNGVNDGYLETKARRFGHLLA